MLSASSPRLRLNVLAGSPWAVLSPRPNIRGAAANVVVAAPPRRVERLRRRRDSSRPERRRIRRGPGRRDRRRRDTVERPRRRRDPSRPKRRHDASRPVPRRRAATRLAKPARVAALDGLSQIGLEARQALREELARLVGRRFSRVGPATLVRGVARPEPARGLARGATEGLEEALVACVCVRISRRGPAAPPRRAYLPTRPHRRLAAPWRRRAAATPPRRRCDRFAPRSSRRGRNERNS